MQNNEQAQVLDNKPSRKIGAFEKRIHEVDFLRGFLIILVLIDHLMYDFRYYSASWGFEGLYTVSNWWWTGLPRAIVQPFAVAGFVFVSGISCAFSKDNWKRACLLMLFGGVISVCTNLVNLWEILDFGVAINFNVIFVLGWSTLIYCFLQNKSWRSLLVVIIASFLISSTLIPVWKNLTTTKDVYLPAFWYPNMSDIGDYLPLFPYIIFFFLGAFLSYFVYAPTKKSIFKHRGNWERPICFLGRHTLPIYLVHQIVYVPVFFILNLIILG